MGSCHPQAGSESGVGVRGSESDELTAMPAQNDCPAPPRGPSVVIEPLHGWRTIGLRDLWHYRELLWILALRDIKVRYKQTVLGALWAVIQPLVATVVFTIFFGYLAGIRFQTGNTPYFIYTFCGMLPWQLFAQALTQSSNSVLANKGLVTKVYFPRLIVPMAPLICGLLDFAIAFVILLGMLGIWWHFTLTWRLAVLPLLVVLTLLASLAVGLWLSALNAIYQDVRYVLGFLTQFWLLATPVAYPITQIPERYRWLCGLNPMAGVVEGFRWALLGERAPDLPLLLASAGMVVVLFTGGLYYFRYMERTFADVV
jgi:lipopolysaccharide transport system permease protein